MINVKANLDYSLSDSQQQASLKILSYIKNGKSVIVNAVCGAGKTELVYKSIEFMVNNNKKVAFAIPRKDVVIEIYNRLKHDYPTLKMCKVHGGCNEILQGSLVVLTTHQLYRYKKYFDMLILDEADAFPYYNNEQLQNFLLDSVDGPIIYLSATIKETFYKFTRNVVYVNRRFHNKDLPVPEIKKYYFFNKMKVLNDTIKSINYKPLLIFVPTISIGKELSNKLKIPFVYSSFHEKEKYIKMFKENKIKQLITTLILERGVTFKNVQVIVYEADHAIFDESSLVQISGRVGRKKDAPYGNIYFLIKNKTESIKKCIKQIKMKNKAIA